MKSTLTDSDRQWLRRLVGPLLEKIERLELRADDIWTADEAAPKLGYINGDSLLQAIRDGRCEVPSVQQGRRVVFIRGDVLEYMAQFRRSATRSTQ